MNYVGLVNFGITLKFIWFVMISRLWYCLLAGFLEKKQIVACLTGTIGLGRAIPAPLRFYLIEHILVVKYFIRQAVVCFWR